MSKIKQVKEKEYEVGKCDSCDKPFQPHNMIYFIGIIGVDSDGKTYNEDKAIRRICGNCKYN